MTSRAETIFLIVSFTCYLYVWWLHTDASKARISSCVDFVSILLPTMNIPSASAHKNIVHLKWCSICVKDYQDHCARILGNNQRTEIAGRVSGIIPHKAKASSSQTRTMLTRRKPEYAKVGGRQEPFMSYSYEMCFCEPTTPSSIPSIHLIFRSHSRTETHLAGSKICLQWSDVWRLEVVGWQARQRPWQRYKRVCLSRM